MSRLDDTVFEEAKRILRDLLRIDTTNPPGNERPAVDYLDQLLRVDGIQSTIIEPHPTRANLVTRLRGDGSREPLLLSSHLDVVPADPAKWTHPPFEAIEADGCIWGRGAIDMKGFAVMALTVFRQLQKSKVSLKRDVILAAVANEETTCEFGSAHLVKHHPDLVRAEYVINEVGGFNLELRGKKFYFVQVAERGIARYRITVRGQPGHSARPTPGSAVEKAAKVLRKLTGARLPHHVSEPMRHFYAEKAKHSGLFERWVLKGLCHPGIGPLLVRSVVPAGPLRAATQANLANTISPTIVRAGSAINVIPSEVVIKVDGRTSPASSAEELLREIRALIGPEHEIELYHEEPAVAFSPDTPMFEEIVKVLDDHDPSGTVLPYMIYGSTDSRNYAKLGATCYGFYPLQLPPDIEFSALFHGDDERIPVEGFRFGIETLYDLVLRMVT